MPRMVPLPPKGEERDQNSPIARMLEKPSEPMMIWSCTAMPSGLPASMMWRVMSISCLLGCGDPLGWLWTTLLTPINLLNLLGFSLFA